MAHLQYNFKGKPMAPYDKSPRRDGWLFIVLGVVIAVLLLLVVGLIVWIALRQPSAPVDSDVATTSAPIELPARKVPTKAAPPKPVNPPVAATPAKTVVPAAGAPAPSSKAEPAAAAQVEAPKASAKPEPPRKKLDPQAAAKAFDAAKKDFAAEKYEDCRESCWKALDWVDESDPLWLQAADLLGKASIAIFTTDVPAPEKVVRTIKPGDTLLGIALANNTTMEAVRRANGLPQDETVIHPGQTFRVYRGSWTIKVDKSKFRLYLYDSGRLFKVYTIGIGRQDRTPEGTFEIGVKQPRPAWYYKGRKYDYGNPENILGTRWMALNPTGSTSKDLKGYGIHGTNDPSVVGKAASNGCVRMRNEDVDELFAIAPMKTPVEIVE